MERTTFNKIKNIVYEKSGISLGLNKEALVSARIGKRMRDLKIDNIKDYLTFLEQDLTGNESIFMIDAISTNVTSFFRENSHFDFLKEIILKWLNDGQRKFRLWSAASSTGEEPYSMAMILYETLTGYNTDLKILATDISTKVLKQCIEGKYISEKMKNISPIIINKFFNHEKTEKENFYLIKDFLKKMITFSRLNLSKPPFPMKGPFDVIFCRNVMIYFDNEVRRRLLEEIFSLLKPGGYLIVGHTESLTGIMMNQLKSVMASVYIKS